MPKQTNPLTDDTENQVLDVDPAEQDTPQLDDQQRIAQRAYERFQQRGGEPGRDQEDWFEAEREVKGTT
jgi:hypothetical protein